MLVLLPTLVSNSKHLSAEKMNPGAGITSGRQDTIQMEIHTSPHQSTSS